MEAADREGLQLKLWAINPHDRNMWRSVARSAIRAAREGRDPTDVDVAPVPAC